MLQPANTKSLVLYADDDPDDRKLIHSGFEPYSDLIDVKTFMNGADLLYYINTLPVDDLLPGLIILDMNMPLLNGLETLKRIRHQLRFGAVPIVLFTTAVSETDRRVIKEYKSRVVLKPLDYVGFNKIMQEFISQCLPGFREDNFLN